VFQIFGVFGRLDGGDFFGEVYANDVVGLWIDVNKLRLVEEIPGLAEPLLAFPPVRRELDRVAIGAMKGFVDIEDGLDIVVAGRKLIQGDERVAESGGIDDGWRPRFPRVYIETEKLGARGFFLAKLKAGLAGFIAGNAEKDMTVERFGASRIGKGKFEAKLGGGLGGLRDRTATEKGT